MVGGSDYSKIAEQLGEGDEGRRGTQSQFHSLDGGGGNSGGPWTHPCAFKDPAPLLWGRGSRGNSWIPPSLIGSEHRPCARHCVRLWREGRGQSRQNLALE